MPKQRLSREELTMSDRIIFLTGHLALPRLEKLIVGFGDEAREWRVINIGVKVAALMTQEIIQRRLNRPLEADRVIVPGRCRADLEVLTKDFGVQFERGPEEVADLAEYLGRSHSPQDLSKYDMRIFAEIVDATKMMNVSMILLLDSLRYLKMFPLKTPGKVGQRS